MRNVVDYKQFILDWSKYLYRGRLFKVLHTYLFIYLFTIQLLLSLKDSICLISTMTDYRKGKFVEQVESWCCSMN